MGFPLSMGMVTGGELAESTTWREYEDDEDDEA